MFVVCSSRVSTIVWLHNLDFNETTGEKARWVLHKDIACCSKQILQNSMATYLPSYKPFKTNKTCWRSKDQLTSDILPWTPTHWHLNIGLCAKTYINQICTDNGCRLEDFLKVMANKEYILSAWPYDDD